ncbi:MAG: hypothetical protein ACYTFT_09605 [Planctomycetota bacterium]|jgi:hypothetical protein
MRWSPLEVDLLAGLEAVLATRPGPCYLAVPQELVGDTGQLVEVLVREGLQYHYLERRVARRRLDALAEEAVKLVDGVEHDRAGEGEQPLTGPGYEALVERIAQTEHAVRAHTAAFEALDESGEDRARAALQGVTVVAPERATELRKQPEGEVLQLFTDGYALEPNDTARLAARRELLGLPTDRDWR